MNSTASPSGMGGYPCPASLSSADQSPESSLLAAIEAFQQKADQREYCNAPFLGETLPPALVKSGEAFARHGWVNFDAAVALLVFAAIAADGGKTRVTTSQGVLLPLSLLGLVACNNADHAAIFLATVQSLFAEMSQNRGTPFLTCFDHTGVTAPMCAAALKKDGAFSAIGVRELSPEDLVHLEYMAQGYKGIPPGEETELPGERPFLHLLAHLPRSVLRNCLGEAARLRYSVAPSNVIRNELVVFLPPPPYSPKMELSAEGREAILGMLALLDVPGASVLHLGEEALQQWSDYHKLKSLGPECHLGEFQLWRQAMPWNLLKIAGLFHRLSPEAATETISAATVRQAISFMEIAGEHAYHSWHVSYTSEEFACALALARHQEKSPLLTPRTALLRKVQEEGYSLEVIQQALNIVHQASHAGSAPFLNLVETPS